MPLLGTSASQNTKSFLTFPAETIEYLVVGGGGGTNSSQSGGGGGGDVLLSTSYSITSLSSWNVTVGGGGSASSFYNITAQPGVISGSVVGAGGGASGNGNAGGGGSSYCEGYGYGGGGGWGAVGSGGFCQYDGGAEIYRPRGGNGGIGRSSSITGSATYYGGGGGGWGAPAFGSSGSSGLGGGGSANTGGGRQGGSYGSGGSGIVVIAYASDKSELSVGAGLTYSVSTSSRAGYRVYIFTAGTGTVTK